MARQILVLAKDITDANRYAKVAGLPRFSYRAVRSAGAIRGVRNAEVHILTSFLRRVDRHAILATLTYARTLDVYYVDFADGEIRDGGETSQVADDPRGPLTERQLEVAYRYNHLRDSNALEAAPKETDGPSAPSEPREDPAPAEEPERRTRRRRCATGEHLVEADELEAHNAEHVAKAASDGYFF